MRTPSIYSTLHLRSTTPGDKRSGFDVEMRWLIFMRLLVVVVVVVLDGPDRLLTTWPFFLSSSSPSFPWVAAQTSTIAIPIPIATAAAVAGGENRPRCVQRGGRPRFGVEVGVGVVGHVRGENLRRGARGQRCWDRGEGSSRGPRGLLLVCAKVGWRWGGRGSTGRREWGRRPLAEVPWPWWGYILTVYWQSGQD